MIIYIILTVINTLCIIYLILSKNSNLYFNFRKERSFIENTLLGYRITLWKRLSEYSSEGIYSIYFKIRDKNKVKKQLRQHPDMKLHQNSKVYLHIFHHNEVDLSILIGISIFMLFQIFNLLKDIYSGSKSIYNFNKIYENIYTQKTQERELFYDKMWKTYIQKSKIADLNKDIFINVTKLIMENRSDGKNLLWKWNQENQAIPYNEFTKFYEELSLYVQEQREEYFEIEKECQLIVNKNNIMLDTFPNNFYNKILKIKHMEFKYGFTSDSTNNVFQHKIENLNLK